MENVKGITKSLPDPIHYGHGTNKKLINYRIIAMLDIMLWKPSTQQLKSNT